MYARDRLANLGMLAGALVAWAVVGILFTTRSPVGDAGIQLVGAVLLGVAFALTSMPLFWLAAFGRNGRIAYRGDWVRALRRGAWVGLLVASLVVVRSQGAFSWPLALFLVVMVGLVEVSLSIDR